MVEQSNDIIEIPAKSQDSQFLRQAVTISWVVLVLAILFQLLFYPEITNIIAMTAVAFAWLVTSKIWLRAQMLETHLISSFMILGFTASQFYFPLIFTTLENKALVHNLELPEEVFLHSTLALLVLVVAHASYRFIMKSTPNRAFSLLGNAGFFDPPAYLQLWILGVIGMASSFYVHYASPEVGQGVTGDPGDKLVQALVPFMYAPFFIPLGKLFGNNEKLPRGFPLMIFIYSVLLFAISIARNSRGAFIFGLTTPAFAYVIGLMLGVFKTKIFSLKNFALGGAVVWLLMGPLTDLGVAMLIVRGSGDKVQDIPPSELITLTLEALEDDKAIEARKEEDRMASMDFDWDERYLDNLFTARFSNIKFNDSNLITHSKIGMYDPDMQEYTLDHLIASLPEPVIKAFNLDVDKEGTLLLSFGDYQYVLSGGYGTPAGLRTGHIAGMGMSVFGWWYLLVLGVIVIPIFYLNDKFFRPASALNLTTAAPTEGKFYFSFCGVLTLTGFFQFFIFESVTQGVSYLMRGWPQIVLLYFLMFHISRIINLMFTGRKRQLDLSPH